MGSSMNSKIRAIARRIKEYNNIVIARHVGPDPDAVASQIAFRDAIKLRYPSKNVYAVGTPVNKFKYYGNLDKVNEDDLKDALLFVLDCPNISRIDGADMTKYKEVIKIDHHPFEDKMGNIEWVDPEASSTCEMITEFLITARFRANKTIAENLFLGVVADSDRFLFTSPGGKTLELMSILIKNSRINIKEIYPRLLLRPLSEVKFQSYITEHLKVTSNGFASLKIDDKIITKYNVDAGTASTIVNNFNNIEELLCWALVSYDEKNKIYKVNIRSRGPVINEIASHYNGGGHVHASGAKITKATDVDKMFKELDQACRNYRKELKSSLKDLSDEVSEESKIDLKEKVDSNSVKEKLQKKELLIDDEVKKDSTDSSDIKEKASKGTNKSKTVRNKKIKKRKK